MVPDLSVYAKSDNDEIELYSTCDVGCLVDNIMETENENNTELDGTKEPGTYTQISTLFLDNYATYYFSQLTINLGVNHKETCSYVAVEMLLSFYDIYWNDNIIDDKYEEQEYFDRTVCINDFIYGPGTKSEIDELQQLKNSYEIGANDKLTDEVYNEFILDYCSTYFHLELIRIGQQHLEESYLISQIDREELLQYYLFTERGFNPSNVSIEYPNCGENIREYIVNNVKRGIPVLVGANNSTGGIGHAFIIYDYDEDEDELYCHMGWRRDIENRNDYSHVALSDTDYVDIYSAMTLEFNTEHICSDSYIYFDEEGTENKECSCYFPCHPEHEHEYKALEGNEDIYHVYDCGCIAENDVPTLHTWTYTNFGVDGHRKMCDKCNHYVYEEHIFEATNNNNSEGHDVYCIECGYTGIEPHDFECDGLINETHYEKCSDCGFEQIGLTNTQSIFVDETKHYDICPECEYLVGYVNHNFDCERIDNTQHEVYCTDCEYSFIAEHDYTDHYVANVDNTEKHYSYCECGAMIEENHTTQIVVGEQITLDVCVLCGYNQSHEHYYTYTSNKDGETHMARCACGSSKTEQCFGPVQSGTLARCLKCKQVLKIGIAPFSNEEVSLPLKKEDDVEETTE